MKLLDVFYLIGRPVSPLYSLVMTLRRRWYRIGLLSSSQLPVPVISVGNLTMGGSGKTPVVVMISRILKEKGLRPAVVSRGYAGSARDRVNIVSNGSSVLLDANQAGDEPFMIAETLRDIPVLTGRKRLHPCRFACQEFGCDVLVLDDGFQHLSVRRDIDIVLFNATTLAGNSRVFPGGDLREPVSALQRADVFLLTGVDSGNQQRADLFSELLQKKFSHAPVFKVKNESAGIFKADGEHVTLDSIALPLYSFSGIAHPERFHEMLKSLDITVVGNTSFKDHTKYLQNNMDQLVHQAISLGAKGLITTQKDIVKIRQIKADLPIYYLEIEAVAEPEFIEFLDKKLFA